MSKRAEKNLDEMIGALNLRAAQTAAKIRHSELFDPVFEFEREKMEDDEIKRDVSRLIANPHMTMGSTYHDASSCWKLIEALRAEIREVYELATVPEQAVSIRPLKQFVATRFVHVEEHNRAIEQLSEKSK